MDLRVFASRYFDSHYLEVSAVGSHPDDLNGVESESISCGMVLLLTGLLSRRASALAMGSARGIAGWASGPSTRSSNHRSYQYMYYFYYTGTRDANVLPTNPGPLTRSRSSPWVRALSFL